MNRSLQKPSKSELLERKTKHIDWPHQESSCEELGNGANEYHVRTADEIVGAKIRERRRALKMTQKQLAEMVGVTFQQVQKYENGNNRISMSAFVKMCHGLRISPDRILGNFTLREDTNSPETDLEEKLLSIFRMIENTSVKMRILKLVEALVLDGEEL
jgi:transcriptional regulator with XRE-family HTH domain